MKIQELNKQQTNEAIGDIVSGVKKFFRKFPASAEKTERKFTNDIVKSISSSLQRAQDFNLLSLTGASAGGATAMPTKPRQEPTIPQSTAAPQTTIPAPANTPTQASPVTSPTIATSTTTPATSATKQTSQPFTFGGQQYIKTNNGWVNAKTRKLADVNTTKILNQAAAKATANPQSVNKPNQSISTGPNNKLAVKGLQMREDKTKNYEKLNLIFENIMVLNEADISVEDFIMNRWYVPWAKTLMQKHPDLKLFDATFMNQIRPLVKEIQNSFSRDNGKAAITKLANLLTNSYYNYINSTGEQPVSSPIVTMTSDGNTTVSQAVPSAPVSQAPTNQPTASASVTPSGETNRDWVNKRFGASDNYVDARVVERYFDNLFAANPTTAKQFLQKLVAKYKI